MINKGKLTLIVSLLLVTLGVFGALALVKKNQDLRKSATVSKTTIRLSPTTITSAVDDKVQVGIFIDTPRKVSTARIKLCYSDVLVTDLNSITNVGPLTVESYKKIEGNCLIISKMVEPSVTVDQLPTGSFQFANVGFTVKGGGSLTVVSVDSLVAGEPVNDDVNIPIDEVVGATITIGGGGDVDVSEGSMSFESSDFTSKKVNENLSVKLYLDTTKNFDAAEVKFCYGDKLLLVDSGITKGTDFTSIAKKTISNSCLEYTVLAMNKSLTGKILLGTFNFKAVSSGTGMFIFDNVVKNYSNVDGLMKVKDTPSVSYTISSASSPTLVPTVIPTSTPVCTNGVKECKTVSLVRECVNNAWVETPCNSVQNCINGTCQTKSASNSAINIKIAFAGVKKGNTQCVVDWLTEMKVKDASGSNPLTVGAKVGSVPVQTDLVNSKGDVVFTYKTYLIEFNSGVTTNGLSFFLTGPKHISIKYGKNNQNSWYSTLAGTLSITGGVDNNYDFSEYPLLVGDVNGDGKINGQDFSLIKEKTQPITTGPQGVDLYADLDGNCQVNAGDVRLIKESLVEINGQTY